MVMSNLKISGTVTMTSSRLMARIAALATCGIEMIGSADLNSKKKKKNVFVKKSNT
jgi:hypothetical protein